MYIFPLSNVAMKKQVSLQNTRGDLLKDQTDGKKDSQLIFVCDWNPILKKLPSLLKRHFHPLQNNAKVAQIFKSQLSVAYRRLKSMKDYLIIHNNIEKPLQPPKSTQPSGKCKLCKNITNTNQVRNSRKKHSNKPQSWRKR